MMKHKMPEINRFRAQTRTDKEDDESSSNDSFKVLTNFILGDSGRTPDLNKDNPEDEDSEASKSDSSDESVYDSTYQEIDTRQHPALRALKLTKRIRKDKRITRTERKALKQRRCIIEYRMRRDNTKAQTSLVNADIPFVQYQQRQ